MSEMMNKKAYVLLIVLLVANLISSFIVFNKVHNQSSLLDSSISDLKQTVEQLPRN